MTALVGRRVRDLDEDRTGTIVAQVSAKDGQRYVHVRFDGARGPWIFPEECVGERR